jgi:hypothetical protein
MLTLLADDPREPPITGQTATEIINQLHADPWWVHLFPVGVWLVSEEDLEALDRYEGPPSTAAGLSE